MRIAREHIVHMLASVLCLGAACGDVRGTDGGAGDGGRGDARPDTDARADAEAHADAEPLSDAEAVDGAADADGDDGGAIGGELIFAFDAGDLALAAYEALVSTMPLGSAGRPQPDTNSYRLPLPIAPQHFAFGIGYEVPILRPDGRVRTWIPEDFQNPHNMFRPYHPTELVAGLHTEWARMYRYELEADFSADSDWAAIPWCIFMQVWGSGYPASWTASAHPRNPPFALSLDGGELEVRVYGEHVTDLDSVADNPDWTHSDGATWAFTPGRHRFEVWIRPDYRRPEDGGVGYVRVDMDGVTVFERDGIVNSLSTRIDGREAGGVAMWGVYSYAALPAPRHPDITFDRVRMYRLP